MVLVVQAELSPVLATIATSLADGRSLRECQAKHDHLDTGELKIADRPPIIYLQAAEPDSVVLVEASFYCNSCVHASPTLLWGCCNKT